MSLRRRQMKADRPYNPQHMNYASCRTCLDNGFVKLKAIEPRRRREHDGSERVVDVVVNFRAPCDCPKGAAWAALPARDRA